MVGLNGLEPSTSRLSGVRSNQLSYRPLGLSSERYYLSKLNITDGSFLFFLFFLSSFLLLLILAKRSSLLPFSLERR